MKTGVSPGYEQLLISPDLILPSSRIATISSCTRYFPKSRLNATIQMVINETNPGLWALVCFSRRSPLERKHLGKLSLVLELGQNPLLRCFRAYLLMLIAGLALGWISQDNPISCGRFFLTSYFVSLYIQPIPRQVLVTVSCSGEMRIVKM
jgi:hypothetical protein